MADVEPLAPAYVLLAYGLWAAPPEPRDTTNDMTDEQIAGLL